LKAKHYARLAGRLLAGGAAIAAASYAAYAGLTWYRYGRLNHQVSGEESDSLLDLYMPEYEVADRHDMLVGAPAEVTFTSICQMNMSQPAIVRAIFKTRELVLGCAAAIAQGEFATCSQTRNQPRQTPQQKEFVAEMKALGWGVLLKIPAQEIVFGAATQPWVTNPVFRAVRPEEFAAFQEPGYVKIVFTLCADPVSASESIARTETRAATTDPIARAKFRRYWALVSPGVILIRRSLLQSVKNEAERRTRELKIEYETAEFGQYTR
jgi:hypothetical protein